jgi:hypothetical protein
MSNEFRRKRAWIRTKINGVRVPRRVLVCHAPSPAPCSCAKTRASGSPSLSFQPDICGAKQPAQVRRVSQLKSCGGDDFRASWRPSVGSGRLAVKRATNLPLSKGAPPVPTFADVARLVAGTDAPLWLAAHFERWPPSLMLDRCIEDKQPKKSEMKERLAEVRDAASTFQHALRHTPTREFLEIAPSGPIEYRIAFVPVFSGVSPLARKSAILAGIRRRHPVSLPCRTRVEALFLARSLRRNDNVRAAADKRKC